MATSESTAPASSLPSDAPPTAAATPGSPRHDELDEALVAVRRVLQRPGYRRRMLEALPQPVELATLRLLRAVQRCEAPPSIGQIADVLVIDPSTASRVVDRAVEGGHLERRACTDDRRRARLHLTPGGSALLDSATARRRELLAEVTASWDDHELAQLLDGLRNLLRGFDALETSS